VYLQVDAAHRATNFILGVPILRAVNNKNSTTTEQQMNRNEIGVRSQEIFRASHITD